MYLSIMFKTTILYIFIIIVYRIMGKKEVGQLGIVDLIVSILIAELAAISIENADDSIFVSIVPIIVLVIIQVLFNYVSLKSDKFRKLIDGNPTVIIKEGKIKFKEMTKIRYSLDDLITQLREQGIKSIEEVDYAILENDGKLSVFQKQDDNNNVFPIPSIYIFSNELSICFKESPFSNSNVFLLFSEINSNLAVFLLFNSNTLIFLLLPLGDSKYLTLTPLTKFWLNASQLPKL